MTQHRPPMTSGEFDNFTLGCSLLAVLFLVVLSVLATCSPAKAAPAFAVELGSVP